MPPVVVNPNDVLHERFQDALVAEIQALNLQPTIVPQLGAVGQNVYGRLVPTDDTDINYPCILVTLEGEPEGFDVESDFEDVDNEYTCRIYLADRQDVNWTVAKRQYLSWRRQIMRTLQDLPASRTPILSGVPEAYDLDVIPQVVVDERAASAPGYQRLISGFTVKIKTREPRGLKVGIR